MLRQKVLVPLYNSARAALVVGSQNALVVPSTPVQLGPTQIKPDNCHRRPQVNPDNPFHASPGNWSSAAELQCRTSASHPYTWQTQADQGIAAAQAGRASGGQPSTTCHNANAIPNASWCSHGLPSVQARAERSNNHDHRATDQAPGGRLGALAAHQGHVIPHPRLAVSFLGAQGVGRDLQGAHTEQEDLLRIHPWHSHSHSHYHYHSLAHSGHEPAVSETPVLGAQPKCFGGATGRVRQRAWPCENVLVANHFSLTEGTKMGEGRAEDTPGVRRRRGTQSGQRMKELGQARGAVGAQRADGSSSDQGMEPQGLRDGMEGGRGSFSSASRQPKHSPGQQQQEVRVNGLAQGRGWGHDGVLQSLHSCVHAVHAATIEQQQRQGQGQGQGTGMSEGQVIDLLNQEWDRVQGHTPSLSVKHVTEVMKKVDSTLMAKGLLRWAAEEKGVSADPQLLCTFIMALTRAQDVEGLDAMAQRLKTGAIPADPWIHNMHVMDIYNKEGRYTKAVEVFHELMENQMEMDDVALSTSMVTFSRLRDTSAVQRLYDLHEERGPSPGTVNVILNSLTKSGKHKEALELFHRAKEGGVVPDERTYTILLESLCKQGLHEEAEAFFAQVEEAGLGSNVYTWSCMMHMYSRQGNIPRLKYWFRRMIKSGCRLNVPTLSALLYGLVKGGLYDESRMTIDWMVRHGRPPSLKTYSLLLESCSEAQEPAERRTLVELMSLTKHKAHKLMTLLVSGGRPGPVPLPAEFEKDRIEPCQEDLSGWFHAMEQGQGTGRTSTTTVTRKRRSPHSSSIGEGSATGGPEGGEAAAMDWEEDKWRQAQELLSEGFEAGGSLGLDLVEEKRSFVDAAVNFLVVLGLDASAARLWEISLSRDVYHGWILVRPQDWRDGRVCTVDLHSMSPGTAVLVAKWTLRELERTFEEQGLLPDKVEFITGWGKRSRVTGSSVLKQNVEHLLAVSRIPLIGRDTGALTIRGNELIQWFKDQRGHGMLSLEDDTP